MRFPLLVVMLGALTLGGAAGLALLAAQPGPTSRWGYTAASFVFVLSTAAAAPPLALASRLGRGFWGVPLRRLADLLACGALLAVPLMPLLTSQLPDWHARPSIWLDWPGAPRAWDTLAAVVFACAAFAAILVPTRPHARAWRGAPKAWSVVTLGTVAAGSLYFMLYVFLQVLTSSDLAMSLVPGWQSANFPAYQAVSGLEGGVAVTVLAMAAIGKHHPVPRGAFHACARLLLALALLWFYFTWAELLTYWYGRTPAELGLLSLLMFGPTLPLFAAATLLSFVIPVALLIWNSVRASSRGAVIAAASVVLGTFFDRIRIYVAAWAVAGPVTDKLDVVPSVLPPPTLADVLVLLGLPAAALLLFALLVRRYGAISRWEAAGAALLREERPFLKTHVLVIAKPD
jgi:hypothetical protein